MSALLTVAQCVSLTLLAEGADGNEQSESIAGDAVADLPEMMKLDLYKRGIIEDKRIVGGCQVPYITDHGRKVLAAHLGLVSA